MGYAESFVSRSALDSKISSVLAARQFTSSSRFSNSLPQVARALQCSQSGLWILRRASTSQIRPLKFINHLLHEF